MTAATSRANAKPAAESSAAAAKAAANTTAAAASNIGADGAELEDRSALLRLDDMSERKQVNAAAWWAFDFALAVAVTRITHDAWGLETRLLAGAAVTAFSWALQQLYFRCGLDRPGSGEMPMDKWWHMAIVHIANTVFFWEWCVGIYDQIQTWKQDNTPALLCVIYAAVAFYFVIWACDLIAGFVHWFGDTTEMYFFTYHHKDSRYMTRQSYVHHTWETFALGLFLSYTCVPVLRTTLIGMSIRLISCQGNECHMWAHCTSNEIPAFIRVLQDLTLVLSWKSHQHHHKPPYLKDYCVFNGWANPFMNIVLPGAATNGLVRFREGAFFQWVKRTLNT